jgi:hypothetical protein
VSQENDTARYEDLTAAEQAGMNWFIERWIAGFQDEAIRGSTAALDLEHQISTLDLDPAKILADQKSETKRLRDQLNGLTGTFVKLHVLGER